MSNAKHTPGPWILGSLPGVILAGPEFELPNGKARAQIATANLSQDLADAETRDANARLITTAPDLLEVVEDAVAIVEALGALLEEHAGEEDEVHRDLLKRFRAAIAKALDAA